MLTQSDYVEVGILKQANVSGNSYTRTVPVDQEWAIQSLCVTYTSDSVIGNRRIAVQYLDRQNQAYGVFPAKDDQAKDLTSEYSFGVGITSDVDVEGGSTPPARITTAIAQANLRPGHKIKIFDVNNISSGDSFYFNICYCVRDAAPQRLALNEDTT